MSRDLSAATMPFGLLDIEDHRVVALGPDPLDHSGDAGLDGVEQFPLAGGSLLLHRLGLLLQGRRLVLQLLALGIPGAGRQQH